MDLNGAPAVRTGLRWRHVGHLSVGYEQRSDVAAAAHRGIPPSICSRTRLLHANSHWSKLFLHPNSACCRAKAQTHLAPNNQVIIPTPPPSHPLWAVVSSLRSGRGIADVGHACVLTFWNPSSAAPNSIWLLNITLVWAVRGLLMGVGTGIDYEFWSAAVFKTQTPTAQRGACCLLADWRSNPAFDLARRFTWKMYVVHAWSWSSRAAVQPTSIRAAADERF